MMMMMPVFVCPRDDIGHMVDEVEGPRIALLDAVGEVQADALLVQRGEFGVAQRRAPRGRFGGDVAVDAPIMVMIACIDRGRERGRSHRPLIVLIVRTVSVSTGTATLVWFGRETCLESEWKQLQ